MATPPGRVGHLNLVAAAGSPESVSTGASMRAPRCSGRRSPHGASVFAYLSAVSIHEAGHYLAKMVIGDPERVFVLHPFDLSHSSQGGVVSEVWGTPWQRAFEGAAGPVLDVVLGVTADRPIPITNRQLAQQR